MHFLALDELQKRLVAVPRGEMTRDEFGKRYTADSPILDYLTEEIPKESSSNSPCTIPFIALARMCAFSVDDLVACLKIERHRIEKYLTCNRLSLVMSMQILLNPHRPRHFSRSRI